MKRVKLQSNQCAVDIEAIGLDVIGGTVWSVATNHNGKTALVHDCNGLAVLDNRTADLLESDKIEKVIHNAAYDVPYLFHNAYRANGKPVKVGGFIWDTDLAEQVIQGIQMDRKLKDDDPYKQAHGTKLNHTLKRYGLVKNMSKEIRERFINREKGIPFNLEEKAYMLGDVEHLLKLRYMQEKVLQRDELMEVALLEMEFLKRVIAMKITGIGFDANFWRELAMQNTREFNRRMKLLPKEVSNWNSEKQVKAYFRKRGIHIESYADLEEVAASTKDKTLEKFISARELHKSVTTYGMNWFEEGFIDPDGRIRFDMRQIVGTGRNSISKPPMHGLPKDGLHRKALIPRKGNVFVIGDFSGQEIGIMAAMADEKVWIDALLRGDDIHSLTAFLIDQNNWNNATERGCKFPKKCDCSGHVKQREDAKTNNFMLAYGGGPKKLAWKTGMSFWDAKVFVRKHKAVIPKLTKMLEKNGQQALITGETYSADPYRRRRVLVGSEDWHVVNQGKNSPIQMAGANMMKLAAISIPAKYYIPLIVHDEILLDVPRKEGKEAVKVLKSTMEKAADYITGIKGLIKVTPRIAENFLKPQKK
jgi:DNA polymerase I